VADSPSGDRFLGHANGRSNGSIAPVSGPLADEHAGRHRRPGGEAPAADPTASERDQILSDADQTMSDSDQTMSDSDQTMSDSDQTSADSDQTSADRDQLAADHDQAASDQDLAAGGDVAEHDISRDIRARSSHEREHTAGRRDDTATARLRAAEQRDAIADSRDVAALARDQAAAARDIVTAQASSMYERADGALGLAGADSVIRGAEQRRRTALQRAKAAENRVLAAEDRLMAERDREQAAQERRRALVDREMLVAELRREHELRAEALEHQHRAEQLARTLKRSLSPPSLPHVSGLDVAVHHEPSAPEDVGGDFYDLFPLGAGRSGFFLGDVCGKGPEAAAITSLARYTMRTAAMLHETPDAILLDLNAALLMHTDGAMQTCTAVYGQIDTSSATAAILLAVAGHPPPLVVREDGAVEATSAHGTLLGVAEAPAFHTCEVVLAPGDAIVICSDGIQDTELAGMRVDEQRLAELLGGASQASAQDLVNRVTDALADVDRPLRDDIAIMALQRTRLT
jgi:serine phosphatase RsbU (regulator of sigma subunit)